MKRLPALFVGVLAVGCCLPGEREALKPLPLDGRIFSYPEILHRARLQAGVALEAFYVDSWDELGHAAKVLEQTAHLLPRTANQPEHLKKVLVSESDLLRNQALQLRAAAAKQNVELANASLQRIHLIIRTLRPTE